MAGAPLTILLAWGLWSLPGVFLARAFGLLPRRDPLLVAAVSFALALSVSTLAAWISLCLSLPASRFVWVLCALSASSAVLLVAHRKVPPPLDLRGNVVAGLASALLLIVLGMLSGGTLNVMYDAPDHVGTMREILASDSFFPTEAFHRDAGTLGYDPRKGLLHPIYAAVGAALGLDPATLWRHLPAFTAFLPLLGIYGFLRLSGAGPAVSLAAGWLHVLTWDGGPGGDMIATSAYPNRVGVAALWIAMGLTVQALRIPTRRSGAAAAVALFAAVAAHPMFTILTALFALLVGVHALLWDRRRLRTLLLIGLGSAILVGPYLLYRFAQYAPANPLHTEIQGMLFFSKKLFIASPRELWVQGGALGLVGYPLAIAIGARFLRRDAGAFLWFAAPFSILFLTLNPFLVPVLQSKVTYLIFRIMWLFPPALAAGAALALGKGRPRVLMAGLFLVCAAPGLLSIPRWARPATVRDGLGDGYRFGAAFAQVEEALPPRSTVLADPVTSLVIPALTSLKVTANEGQHSSPNDALALKRILRARDVLSPFVHPAVAWTLARDAGADAVYLNGDLPSWAFSVPWAFDPEAVSLRARQLEASPCFETLVSDGRNRLFRLASACDTTAAFDLLAARFVPSGDATPLFTRDGWSLLKGEAEPDVVTLGSPLRVRLLWSTSGARPRHPSAALRLDAIPLPGGDAAGGKLVRVALERLTGRKHRQRMDWIPTGGWAPPERWPEGMAVADTITITPSAPLVPGRYRVTVGVNYFTEIPNFTLRDYLYNEDLFSGVAIDTITVTGR